MTAIRLAWFVLAIVATAFGVFVASWQIFEITNCEIGLSGAQAECNQSIWGYSGWSVLPVLAVPVLLCLIPAVIPRPWSGWFVVGLLAIVLQVFSIGRKRVPRSQGGDRPNWGLCSDYGRAVSFGRFCDGCVTVRGYGLRTNPICT